MRSLGSDEVKVRLTVLAGVVRSGSTPDMPPASAGRADADVLAVAGATAICPTFAAGAWEVVGPTGKLGAVDAATETAGGFELVGVPGVLVGVLVGVLAGAAPPFFAVCDAGAGSTGAATAASLGPAGAGTVGRLPEIAGEGAGCETSLDRFASGLRELPYSIRDEGWLAEEARAVAAKAAGVGTGKNG